MALWNPWHGCTKISPGCVNCYMYARDAEFGKDSSVVTKTASFNLPVKRTRQGAYKLQPDGDYVYTCMTSDFFHPDADPWRAEAWSMMRIRADLSFFIITKRPERFYEQLPDDWGSGYENVTVCCTCDNQDMTDRRLPWFLSLPIRHKAIICEPLLGPINLTPYLGPSIEQVIAGGESGPNGRICRYEWVVSLLHQCVDRAIPFRFKQTGTRFRYPAGMFYCDNHRNQIHAADVLNLNYMPEKGATP